MVLVDEPSNGLAPKIVSEVFEILKSLHNEGITILLVEQNVRQTLNISDRAYVLENGHIVQQGVCSFLKESDHVRKAYLGL
jgi:branched-chain amino acid transport system ATP-binding protein